MNLRRASAADAGAFAALIRGYPFKGYQQKAQGLDRDRLNEFLAENTSAALSDARNAAWLVEEGAAPIAGAILGPNEWHSRFYEVTMGRCDTFLSYTNPERATPALLEAIEEEARSRKYACVNFRVDGGDYRNLHRMESGGLITIDCSIKMDALLKGRQRASGDGLQEKQRGTPGGAGTIQIRPCAESDFDDVIRIARSSHVHNHFFNDARLSREATERLFGAWVERCLKQLGATCFVAADKQGRVFGFVTYLVGRKLNERLGVSIVILDYIVLDRAAQGQGLGGMLLEGSLAALADRFERVELRTSQNNYPALAMYARHGFRTVSTDFLLNRWYD